MLEPMRSMDEFTTPMVVNDATEVATEVKEVWMWRTEKVV
jgi:hypothetical protein